MRQIRQRRFTPAASDFALALRALVTLLCAAFVASCSVNGGPGLVQSEPLVQPGEAAPRSPAIKVAMLLPLSGGNAQGVAKTLKQAGELALFDFDNPNFELISKDTLGTPEGAKAAAEEAVAEGAELILGPLFANEVRAAAPVTQVANVPMVAFSSDQKVAGNGVYLLSFLAGSDVPRILAYAASQGKTRLAALIPQTDYGRLVQDTFIAAAQDLGLSVLAVKTYPQDANGMIQPVKDIAQLTPKGEEPQIDALFMPADASTLPALAPLLPYSDVDTKAIQLLGTNGWDFTGVGKETALVGAWFPAPNPQGWADFTRRYVETYGEPPQRLATLGYDAVSLAISLSSGSDGSRFTSDRLTRSNGFSGVDGLFRLRSDGTSQRGFAILEVQQLGNQVIETAPSGFTSAQY